jgi:colanic acid/amylovoran biosynthesis protein
VLFLHGINYWNLGDLGIFQAMAASLARALGRYDATVLTTFAMAERPRHVRLAVEPRVLDYPILEPARGLGQRARMLGRAVLLPLLAVLYRSGPRIGMRRWFPRSCALFDVYLEADLVVSKGGNFLMDTGHRVPTWFLPTHQILLAVLLRRPVVVYAQSLGPFRGRLGRAIVGAVLRRVDLVILRERGSLALLPQAMNMDRVHVTSDEAFLLEPSAALPAELAGLLGPRTIAATVIAWEFPGLSPEGVRAARERYYDAMAACLDALAAGHDADILLLPHVAGWGGRNDAEAIDAILARARERARYRVAPDDVTPEQEVRLLAGCALCIGTRMHSVIFALAAGTPVLAVGYLPKTVGVLGAIGLADWVVPIEAVDRGALLAKAEALLRDPAARAAAEAARDRARDLARANATLAAQLVGVHGDQPASPARAVTQR